MDIAFTTDKDKAVLLISKIKQYEASWLEFQLNKSIVQTIIDDTKVSEEQKNSALVETDKLTSLMNEADQLHAMVLLELESLDKDHVTEAKKQFGL